MRAETFCIIIPTYNRAETLPKALDSLFAQTYTKWEAYILDDGSTDKTEDAIVKAFTDERLHYERFRANRGGVAMNEIGMQIAIDTCEWWTRLGSDDWFEPDKLARDADALQKHEAVYGDFKIDMNGRPFPANQLAIPPEIIREFLWGEREIKDPTFVISWANCAVRSSVLKRVKERWGRFADPRLRNMEDFLVNARIALEADWVWRSEGLAWWRQNAMGASADTKTTDADREMTIKILREDQEKMRVKEAWDTNMAANQPRQVPLAGPRVAWRPRAWPALLRMQTQLAYGDGIGGPSPNTEEQQRLAKQHLNDCRLESPSLIVGPGGPAEVDRMAGSLPGRIFVLTAHAPEIGLMSGDVSVGDMHDMPYASGRFGVVFANNVLEHAFAPYLVLLECRRVLRDGGHAYFIMPSFAGHEGGVGPFHLHCLTEEVWRELLRKTGLKVRETLHQPGVDSSTDHYVHYICEAVEPPEPGRTVLGEVKKLHEDVKRKPVASDSSASSIPSSVRSVEGAASETSSGKLSAQQTITLQKTDDFKVIVSDKKIRLALKNPRVLICTPCYGYQVHAEYMLSMWKTFNLMAERGLNPTILFRSDSLITRARNFFLSTFYTGTHDALLQIDADQSWDPKDVVDCVDACLQGLDFTGISVPNKGRIELALIEQRLKEGKLVERAFATSPVEFFPEDFKGNQYTGEVAEVDGRHYVRSRAVGGGVMCVSRAAVTALIEAHPESAFKAHPGMPGNPGGWDLFAPMIDPLNQTYANEDRAFSLRYGALGKKVWVLFDAKVTHWAGATPFEGGIVDMFGVRQES